MIYPQRFGVPIGGINNYGYLNTYFEISITSLLS